MSWTVISTGTLVSVLGVLGNKQQLVTCYKRLDIRESPYDHGNNSKITLKYQVI